MLAKNDLKSLIGPILRKRFSRSGLGGFSIEFDEDHEGDPSIFIIVEFKISPSELEAIPVLDSLHEIRDVLQRHGDPRLPYFRYRTSEAHQGAEA